MREGKRKKIIYFNLWNLCTAKILLRQKQPNKNTIAKIAKNRVNK